MERKNYENPEIKIVEIEVQDVITASQDWGAGEV